MTFKNPSRLEQGSFKSINGMSEKHTAHVGSVIMSWTLSLWNVGMKALLFHFIVGLEVKWGKKKWHWTWKEAANSSCGYSIHVWVSESDSSRSRVCATSPAYKKNQFCFDTWWPEKLKSRDIIYFIILSSTKIVKVDSKWNHELDFYIWHYIGAKNQRKVHSISLT